MPIWERIAGKGEGTTVGAILAKLSGLAGVVTGSGQGGADASPAGIANAGVFAANTAVGPHAQIAFTIAIVALGAKMAKADGRVTPDEVAAFKQVFTVAPEDMANVGRVFDLARKDIAGYEAYADQIGRLFKDNKPLLQDVLEGLFHVATADSVLHPAEDQFLAEVARRFGFTDSEYAYVRAHFIEDGDADPWHVLSLTPDAGDAEIRSQYRRLVAENHPDKYIARGLPKEVIDIANRKLTAINAAYDAIARERGLK